MVRVIVSTILFCFSWAFASLSAQNYHQTFKDTRVINSQSVETLRKGVLDFRIGHRFGDVNGGWQTLWGLENAADVIFEFDYGITDNLMVGIMRAKGAGPLTQNVSGLAKYRVLRQSDTSPFSLAFSGLATISTMPRGENPGRINFFAQFAHRMSYNIQVILASKVSDRLALQIAPQWTYRNIVPSNGDPNAIQDTNDLASVSGALKYQLSKTIAIILDGTLVFSEFRREELDADGNREFSSPFGIGIEWETGGGHVFQANFTNATGIVETDYIPYTQSQWLDREFRFGFTIARQFNLKR